MDDELTQIESKVECVIALCQALRDENRTLHERVALLEQDKQGLVERIETAKTRLESFMERLPAE